MFLVSRHILEITARLCINMESTPPILKLPAEIVTIILEPLAVEDKVCFSLSCKYIYNCFTSLLSAERMQLSHLLPREKYPTLFPNIDKAARIQLLRRLQNAEWEYCCDCWILHPRPRPRDLQGRYCLPCQKLHGRQCFTHGLCMPYAGVVALCPCLTISFRDKIKILEDIISTPEDQWQFGSTVCRGSSRENLLHSCRIQHPTIDAHLHTSIGHGIRQGKAHLIISSRYVFSFSHESASSLSKSEAMCPHENIKRWLKQFFTEAGSSFSGWRCKRPDVSQPFLPEIDVKITANGKQTLAVSFERDLGSFDWPDRYWTHTRTTN